VNFERQPTALELAQKRKSRANSKVLAARKALAEAERELADAHVELRVLQKAAA